MIRWNIKDISRFLGVEPTSPAGDFDVIAEFRIVILGNPAVLRVLPFSEYVQIHTVDEHDSPSAISSFIECSRITLQSKEEGGECIVLESLHGHVVLSNEPHGQQVFFRLGELKQ